MDPELNVSIVDMGFIYSIKQIKSKVKITMTLTTIGCPLFPIIRHEIETKLKEIKGIDTVTIDLVFDPAWNMNMMSKKARLVLGI